MKKFTLISLLATLAFSHLCGETKTYWQALEPYHKMTRVYWNVRKLDENSVRYAEFIKARDEFRKKSVILQQKIKENNLGDDLMFDKYADLLIRQTNLKGYDRREGVKRNKVAGSAMRMDDITVGHIFLLISNDFKTLRDAGLHEFPTPEILKEWVPVYQYIRMFRYFREISDKIEQYSHNYAWGHMFDKRLYLMLQNSQKVQKILEERMPELVKYNNIHTETRVLLTYCSAVRKTGGVVDVSLNSNYNKLAKGGKSDKRLTVLKSDMRLAMQNIDRILKKFNNEIKDRREQEKRAKQQKKREEQKKKQQQEQEKRAKEREQQKEQAAKDAKTRALSAEEKTRLNRMSDDQLAEHMGNHYNSIFPSDSAKSISAEKVQQCMNAMTDSQKEYYESVKARYVRTGNSEKQAELKALKTVRPLLNSSQLRPTRAEMIRTLKK